MPTKAVYLPGVGAKKDGCKAVSHPGAKNFFEVGLKGRNAKKGVGAKRMGAKQIRTWVQKKNFGRSAPAPTFVKS